MDEDYKIELQNDDMQELEMFADIKEEDLVDYDTVDVLDISGTFRTEDIDGSKYINYPKYIVGDNTPSRRIPNVYKTDICELLAPTYKALLLWEDARAAANLTLLELYSFDIIKDIWKNLESNNSIIVLYDSIYQELGEYTGSLVNFTLCALRYRGIIALDISKYAKNRRCLFISREKLTPKEIVDKVQARKVVVKANLLLDVAAKDIMYNSFIYNINRVERFKRATKVMQEYNSSIYERDRKVNDTLANAKSIYKAAVNLLLTIVSLYKPNIRKDIDGLNNDTLEYLWQLLPQVQQTNFETMYQGLYNLYESTNELTEGGIKFGLMDIVKDVNKFFEYVKQYFNSRLKCQACMQLPQEDLIDLLLLEWDIDSKQESENIDEESIDEATEEVSRNSEPQEKRRRTSNRKPSSQLRARDTNNTTKETMADRARRNIQERKDNGDFRAIQSGAKKAGKSALSKSFEFCRNNPRSVVMIVVICFVVWILYKLVHFIGSIF